MKKFIIAIAAMGVLATPSFSDPIPLMSPRQAGQHQGNVAAVRGRAQIYRDAEVEGTDVDLVDARGNVTFVGFIPQGNEYAFPRLSRLNGRVVTMYGVIELYQGHPATQLNYSGQLRAG